ncbi:MAG: tetratricopeptide repeat protein [Myxococcota bacterium]
MRLPRFAPVLLAALLLAPAAACDKSKEPTPEEIEAKLKADLEEAAARVRNNKTKDAEKIYLRILETHADQPDAVGGLGKVRLEEKKYAEAEKLLAQASNAKSDNASLWAALGQARQLQDNPKGAAEAFAMAFKIEPDNSSYGLSYGRMLRDAEDFAKAEEILRKVAELDPKAPYVNTDLGDALRGQDKLDDALKHYMKGQNANRSDKRAHAGAAFVYEKKGDNKHALDEWSSYIRMDCCSDFSKTVAQKKIESLKVDHGGDAGEGEGAGAAE